MWMLAMGILVACLVGVAAWMGSRRAARATGGEEGLEGGHRRAVDGAVPRERDVARADVVQPEMAPLEAAANAVTPRLWRLAFAVPAPSATAVTSATDVTADAGERERIMAALTADDLDLQSLPRRPTLLPQLMQAVNDPSAASERISRMIAHDPVLTADVLRLANSSLYRTSPAPIETIHRALVVCGVDALRGMLATALLSPVFKATRGNFPRFPRLLWERTEGAVRAAESYALQSQSPDRFEAQLLVLLRALGPLAVYTTALEVYKRSPALAPNPALCAELVGSMGPAMSLRIARDWQMAERLLGVLEGGTREPLAYALHLGEFLSTLALLEAHQVIAPEQRDELVAQAGVSGWAGGPAMAS
jgi:HD-like signal output (HDOD) protein